MSMDGKILQGFRYVCLTGTPTPSAITKRQSPNGG